MGRADTPETFGHEQTLEARMNQFATKALRLTVAIAFEIRDSRAIRAAASAAEQCRRWLF